MRSSRFGMILPLLLIPALAACGGSQTTALEFTDREREELTLLFSEPPGYFDTDNLISNETSYQQVVPLLERLAPKGQAYIGVGPDQNYTYMAHSRPALAFLVDIRRDNLLQHLYLKELFHMSGTRLEFLSHWFGKPLPAPFLALEETAPVEALVEYFRRLPSEEEFFEATFVRLWKGMVSRSPRTLRDSDRDLVREMSESFFRSNLDLKFQSHGRPPRLIYPSLSELMTESDLNGAKRSYLAREDDYLFIRSLHLGNRIVPVVGDLAGEKSLREIGAYLARKELSVAVLYVSNVEFYLFRGGSFWRYMANLKALPVNPHSLVVRSYFGYWRHHPQEATGYPMTSLVQNLHQFLDLHRESPYLFYEDLVFRDYLENDSRISLGAP